MSTIILIILFAVTFLIVTPKIYLFSERKKNNRIISSLWFLSFIICSILFIYSLIAINFSFFWDSNDSFITNLCYIFQVGIPVYVVVLFIATETTTKTFWKHETIHGKQDHRYRDNKVIIIENKVVYKKFARNAMIPLIILMILIMIFKPETKEINIPTTSINNNTLPNNVIVYSEPDNESEIITKTFNINNAKLIDSTNFYYKFIDDKEFVGYISKKHFK